MVNEEPAANIEQTRKSRGWRKRILSWLVLLVAGYLLLVVGLVVAEPYLMFPAPKVTGEEYTGSTVPLGLVYFSTSDEVELCALFYRHPESDNVILFCHGNAEWVGQLDSYMVDLGRRLKCSVMAFDYRGYGLSEGRTTGAGLVLDGQAAYDFLIESGFAPERIVVYGRSLGGAVAVSIAEKNPIGALVLRSTFSSMTEVAHAKFPFLPVPWLIRNRMPSAERLANYRGPLLQRHGTADRVVPFRFGKKLFDAAGTPESQKEFIVEEGANHFDWPSDQFWQSFARLVDDLDDRSSPSTDSATQ